MAEPVDEKKADLDRSGDGYNTYIINYGTSYISARILEDKTDVTQEYQKLYNFCEHEIKTNHGIGVKLGVPDVGDLGVDYKKSDKKGDKMKTLKESWQNLRHLNVKAGFQTIRPYESIKIYTAKKDYYLTIFLNGDCKERDNWHSTDREIYVKKDGTIETAAHVKLGPIYNNSLFSTKYQGEMEDGLDAFQLIILSVNPRFAGEHALYPFTCSHSDLYDFSKTDSSGLLSDGTVTSIAQTGMDFYGVNLSTSWLLSLVQDRWLGKTVKELYSNQHIKMTPRQVGKVLGAIVGQAKELGTAWDGMGAWYVSLHSEVISTSDAINFDEEVFAFFSTS